MDHIKKLPSWYPDWVSCLILERATRKLLKKLPVQKYLIMGYARHGKDTVAELLAKHYKIKFTPSTKLAAEHIVYPMMRTKYRNVEECFKDRGNHREFWFKAIQKYNTPNKTNFISLVLGRSDIYCGLRCAQEFTAAVESNCFDFIIWVNADKRKPPESTKSCSVRSYMADTILDNNTTKMALRKNLAYIMYSHAYYS